MATEKRIVVMYDGRTVGFGKVEKVQKEILKDTSGRPTGIRFDADNGETFFAAFADLPDADWVGLAEPTGIGIWAMAHGFSQKLGDSYAAAESSGDCMETVRILWTRLCEGNWNSDVRGFATGGLLLEAILLAFPNQGREQARTILAELKPAERLALQLSPAVKPHFDALQSAKAKGDTTGLIAKFQ